MYIRARLREYGVWQKTDHTPVHSPFACWGCLLLACEFSCFLKRCRSSGYISNMWIAWWPWGIVPLKTASRKGCRTCLVKAISPSTQATQLGKSLLCRPPYPAAGSGGLQGLRSVFPPKLLLVSREAGALPFFLLTGSLELPTWLCLWAEKGRWTSLLVHVRGSFLPGVEYLSHLNHLTPKAGARQKIV